ncbi:hypothetical protein BS47DRAFT_38115 [Hydnum rufescens UP504]|uniref:Uncharacterized protein n=1 Tax=Hydnum rufescens UP504 TaxID=1448309 RepID=A0A9P6ACF7_9AGAM|nr:hypothetical protein BS47DRAFT_38115 [Hydnum rufescens UP504]
MGPESMIWNHVFPSGRENISGAAKGAVLSACYLVPDTLARWCGSGRKNVFGPTIVAPEELDSNLALSIQLRSFWEHGIGENREYWR